MSSTGIFSAYPQMIFFSVVCYFCLFFSTYDASNCFPKTTKNTASRHHSLSFFPFKKQADYPGLRVGPEPTTDKFVAIMAGPSRQQLPGGTCTVG